MAITNCKECGGQISTKAAVCPHCGAKLIETPGCKGRLLGCGANILVSLTLLIIIGTFVADDDDSNSTPSSEHSALQERSAASESDVTPPFSQAASDASSANTDAGSIDSNGDLVGKPGDASFQPLLEGRYVQIGEHEQEVMHLSVSAENGSYYVHMTDPETNAVGSLRGCMVMAESPLAPGGDGAYLAKGVDLSDEKCSLKLRPIRAEGVEVVAEGCEDSCISPQAAHNLSGRYLLQQSSDDSIDEGPSSPAPALSDQPVMVEIVPGVGSVTIIRVVGKMDRVAVLDVTANRGNCATWIGGTQAMSGNLQPAKGMNQTLAFGETADFYINNSQCRLIDVEVNTDAGAWSFTIQ